MRVGSEDSKVQMLRLAAAIEQYGQGLFGHYVVVETGRFRARSLWNVSSGM